MRNALLKLPAYEKFGPFDLLRRIDSGGMAEVVLARERLEGGDMRLVALKRLLPQLEKDWLCVEMFKDEARLARLVDHPGVVRAYDFGRHKGLHFLSLEWIHGVSLAALAKAAPGALPVPAVLRVLSDVAAAVHYTHRLKDASGQLLEVVHRDITPPNIMLGFDGSVKILDFGLAKATTQSCSTASGFVKGKLRYLAPEQVHEGGELSYRVDVFAIGLCGFEALVGRPLFDQVDPLDAARAIVDYSEPPSIRSLRPDAPSGLEELLRSALEPDPSRRIQSARKLHLAFEKLLKVVEPGYDAERLGRLVTETFPIEAVAVI